MTMHDDYDDGDWGTSLLIMKLCVTTRSMRRLRRLLTRMRMRTMTVTIYGDGDVEDADGADVADYDEAVDA